MNSFHSGNPQISSFQSLPYEIREQIYLYTLLPRLVYIHPHQRLEPPPYDSELDEIIDGKRLTVSVRFSHSLYSPYNTPAEAFASYASFVTPEFHLGNGTNHGEMAKFERKRAIKPLDFRSPEPPPVLYICQESRAIALRRGYVLAFKGVNLRLEGEDKKYWEKNDLSAKGIWINFDSDLIMIDALRRPMKHCKNAPLEPLVLLHKWASDDARKIRYLALGGNPGSVLRALRGNCVPVAHGSRWRTEWQWWVSLGFDNLEEIWIDDEFEIESAYQRKEHYEDGWHDWQCQEGASKQYTRAMSLGKSKLPHWTSSLPQVKVVRGTDWHLQFGQTTRFHV